ncbi:MAG TPA: DUF6273 domain-containing protein [Firmicutes bacterium]|nr:DUF6273 domain-containing protein [Bacillota bacterium]
MEHWTSRLEAGYQRYCGLLFGALALVMVACVLFVGQDVGLSNNGDFVRTMAASSLRFGNQLPSHTYVDTFQIVLPHPSAWQNVLSILFGGDGLANYPSLHVLPVRVSVVLSLVVNKLAGLPMDTYHLEVLGGMYTLLYAAGIGLLLSQFRLRRLWQDLLVKLAALVVLCDIGYVAYFNSLYGEALEHIALVYCAAMLVRVLTRQPTVWDGVWCALAAASYGWAKFFNIPVAILLVLVLEGIVLVRLGRRRVLAAGGAALALLLGVWAIVPGWMDVETNYNAVFYGIVRDVDEDTAKEYLSDLGLPEELSDYRDTNYYLGGLLESLEARGLRDAAESVTKLDLVRFYLTHPGRLWEQMQLTALHCGMIRPYYLANYGGDQPLMSYSQRMSLWSTARDALPFDTLAGNLAVPAAFTALAVLVWRRRLKPAHLALLLLALWGALGYCYGLPVMLNGEGDFAKHMFAFLELLDLLLLACLALALDRAGRGRPEGVLCPAVGGALALALLLPPAWDQAASLWQAGQAHSQLQPGSYVTLGNYGGQPLTWLVVGQEEDRFTLLCQDEAISLPFDEDGGNDWLGSTLRTWLNDGFLDGFSPDHLALLQAQDNTVLLPDHLRGQAQEGHLDFACTHIAVLADRGYDRAYRRQAQDTVTLPDIDLIATLARAGQDISGASYWLETPYCPSDALVRYAARDGHLYFGPAQVARVVRPVVQITGAELSGGNGSRAHPFLLSWAPAVFRLS